MKKLILMSFCFCNVLVYADSWTFSGETNKRDRVYFDVNTKENNRAGTLTSVKERGPVSVIISVKATVDNLNCYGSATCYYGTLFATECPHSANDVKSIIKDMKLECNDKNYKILEGKLVEERNIWF